MLLISTYLYPDTFIVPLADFENTPELKVFVTESPLPNFFVTVSAPVEYVIYTPSSLASMPLIAPLSLRACKSLFC